MSSGLCSMLATSCCCWKRRKEKIHSAVRLNRSRSLDKVTLGQYTDLVLQDKYYGDTMGNSLAPESLEGEKELHTIKKTESSASLKSSSSAKSSSSRRSKVTFTETNPEVHMIPPKSPPKPKRSRGPKPAAYSESDCDLILREDESQAAFQFDLSQTAQVTSLEDLEKYNNNNNNNNNSQSSRSKKKARTPEDVQEVRGRVVPLSLIACFSVIQPDPARLT